MRVVAVTRESVGRVSRWRGAPSGHHVTLQAQIAGEWCQVIETRSDPGCLPPRRLRLRSGEFAWQPQAAGMPPRSDP